MTDLISVTDGRISIISPELLGVGPVGAMDCGPQVAAAAIVAGGDVVGWLGYDAVSGRLEPGVAYVRHGMQAHYGSRGIAFRALQLLMHHLATRTACRKAIIQPPPGDAEALAVAAAAGFTADAGGDHDHALSRSVPPLTYTDSVRTIRRQRVDDIDRHLEGIDDEQIDWLWERGDRQKWEALTPGQQRARNLTHLQTVHDSFGTGPKWTFSVDRVDAPYVAYIDCDLANDHVPAGEANIAYAGHPAHRGQGNVSGAIRLVAQFLREHTGAQSAHIVVDARNAASLRVARAVATETERWPDDHGRLMIRHVLPLR